MRDADLDLTILLPLVDMLLAASGHGACDRVLAEALRATSGASGVALWRGFEDQAASWTPVFESGAIRSLPSAPTVHAVLAGVLDGELGDRARVLGPVSVGGDSTGDPAGKSALAVALVGPFDGDLDLAEALLVLVAQIEAVPGARPFGDRLPGALPLKGPPTRFPSADPHPPGSDT